MFALQKSKSKTSSRNQIAIKGVRDGVLMLPNNEYRASPPVWMERSISSTVFRISPLSASAERVAFLRYSIIFSLENV